MNKGAVGGFGCRRPHLVYLPPSPPDFATRTSNVQQSSEHAPAMRYAALDRWCKHGASL